MCGKVITHYLLAFHAATGQFEVVFTLVTSRISGAGLEHSFDLEIILEYSIDIA